jgi:signal transduction histidine kinase/BarA-like signal transduction histidine kinase
MMISPIKRVLLVEDDEDDVLLTSDYLQQVSIYQFDIQWTNNSIEALELLKENKHDICLLDYQLGSINGLAVLKEAMTSGCTIPIIMLTGQSDNTLDNDALDAGAVDYVTKSELNTTRFHRAIRYALSRKEVEDERLERIKAETKSRSKDKFIAHLSHELRTPLTSILGYTELLLFNEENTRIHAELRTILNNGKHLLGLLNNVLDLSKIAANKLELNYSQISLEHFLVDLYTLMSVTAEDKGITLNINAKTPLPLEITADIVRLRQIFINLIHNAIKFTDKGSVTINLWLDNSNNKNTLHFTISDTGIGIPEHLLTTIFKPFEQVEDIVSRNEEGAGLGLAICCELLKKMGGTIKVESKENIGSKFIINLDIGDISDTSIEALSFNCTNSRPSIESFSPLTAKILIVDDIKDIRNLIGFICHSFGLKTAFATNGEHAISKVTEAIKQEEPFDCILMDIHMPVLDGKRTILKLREMGITTPIIAVTAATMKGVHQELKSLGFNDVVAKPVDKQALYKALTQNLATKKITTLANTESITKADNSLGEQEENVIKTLKHFLIIEDDKDAAQITALLLNSLDIKTTIAYSAAEARSLIIHDKIDNEQYDRILLDVNLPDANGLTFSKELKTLLPKTKITIVSGNDITQENLHQFNIDQSLLKPINLDMLRNIL